MVADAWSTSLDFETARKARNEALKGIDCLLKSLALVEGRLDLQTFEQMQRAIGLAIGNLEVDYLQHIFALHPELDDVLSPESVQRNPDGSVIIDPSPAEESL